MSYILDALRKSDQQRRQGVAPTLSSAQIQDEENPRPKFFWLILTAFALLLAGILIGWWRPWQTPQPPAAAPVAARQEAPPAVPPPAPVQTVIAPAPRPAPAPALAAPAAADPPVRASATLSPPAPKPAAAEPAVAPAPPPAEAAQTGSETKAVARNELPPALQQELPKMVVALHAYSSKPKSRLVSINDQLLHEGESLSPGLVLEQITPDGMVFSFRGYRFRQGVQ